MTKPKEYKVSVYNQLHSTWQEGKLIIEDYFPDKPMVNVYIDGQLVVSISKFRMDRLVKAWTERT